MKSSNRWLLIIGIVLAALVIGTTTLVLTLKNNSDLLPENTPDGVVQRYLIALKNSDFQTAYDSLSADTQARLTYSQWKPEFYSSSNGTSWQATLGKPTVNNNSATLDVIINRFYVNNGIINNQVNSQTITFQLEMESGLWKISQPDYYFLY